MSLTQNGAADLINQLVGIAPDSALAEVRNRRPEVVAHSQGSYEAIFQPVDPVDLSVAERHLAGLRVAVLTPSPLLIAHHRQQAADQGVDSATIAAVEAVPLGAGLDARLQAMITHIDRLTLEPVTAEAAHVQALEAAGFSVRAIVALSQLIAFTSYQARVLVALQLLDGQQPASATQPRPPHADGKGVTGWTAESLEWQAWLSTLRLEEATDAQIAVLEESTPTAKTSPYYLLLVQEVAILRERSKLYNAIMYGPRGLRRADRELGALATSRVNGCVYCASVHAQRYTQLSRQPEVVEKIFANGVDAQLDERERAVVDYAVKLTRHPAQMTPADLTPLRQLGLDDGEILDLTNAVAVFAWANRLMLTLGEPAQKA
jgi:CMD domain protein